MKVWVLGSGSSGNAVLVECEGSRVLVDAGFGSRTLGARLQLAGVDPRSIEACVLTHDHSDHVRGTASAVRRWKWRVFATAGTACCADLADVPVTTFAAGATLRFSRLELEALATPHDASEPVGFIATSRSLGARAGICYDIGHASDAVRLLCRDVDVLILEANHDEGMLRTGPYPPWLRARIASSVGHLSNRAAGELVRDVATPRLSHLVLAHLSEINNAPEIAHRTVRASLRGSAFRGKVSLSTQDGVVGPFAPRGAAAGGPAQLSLF